MIPYHGTSITLATAAAKVLKDRHAFVSFLYRQTLDIAVEVARSFAVDCGAFTAWKQGVDISETYQRENSQLNGSRTGRQIQEGNVNGR